jgi:hypothetical protein
MLLGMKRRPDLTRNVATIRPRYVAPHSLGADLMSALLVGSRREELSPRQLGLLATVVREDKAACSSLATSRS